LSQVITLEKLDIYLNKRAFAGQLPSHQQVVEATGREDEVRPLPKHLVGDVDVARANVLDFRDLHR